MNKPKRRPHRPPQTPQARASAQLLQLRHRVQEIGLRPLARKLGAHPTKISRAIDGKQWPRLDIVADLAAATGVKIEL